MTMTRCAYLKSAASGLCPNPGVTRISVPHVDPNAVFCAKHALELQKSTSARVAQSVEHQTLTLKVGSSSLPAGAT